MNVNEEEAKASLRRLNPSFDPEKRPDIVKAYMRLSEEERLLLLFYAAAAELGIGPGPLGPAPRPAE